MHSLGGSTHSCRDVSKNCLNIVEIGQSPGIQETHTHTHTHTDSFCLSGPLFPLKLGYFRSGWSSEVNFAMTELLQAGQMPFQLHNE